MPRTVLLIATIVVSAIFAAPAWPQQAVFIVRHAERADGSPDSALSPAGRVRAERLARMLHTSGIGTIFVTQLRRTVQTASPLAQALRLEPIVLPGTLELVKAVQAQLREHAVLVVGHGSTIPQILEGLGYEGNAGVDFDKYDNLLVLIPGIGVRPILLHLKY